MANELITLTRNCRWCKETYKKDFPLEGVQLYEAGALLQNAFPDLPAGEREQFKTGIHPACWDEMWCDQNDDCEVHYQKSQKCPPLVLKDKFAKEAQ